MLAALWCSALLLAAPPAADRDAAHATNTADEAEFRFRHGAELYKKGRFDDALGEFFESNRLVPNRNVQFNIARCLEQLGLYNEAYRYYGDIVEARPPKEDLDAALESQERLRPHVALVRVESAPPGATIYVDRKDLGPRGATPKEIALPPGDAKVLLDLPGFHAASAPARLAVGREASVTLVLDRIYGEVLVRGEPAGAVARLDRTDGDVWSQVGRVARAAPGHHAVFVDAPGFAGQRYDVEVPPDGRAELAVHLRALPPPAGAIVVRANLDGALVSVDGKPAGFTPTVLEGIAEGRHDVSVGYDNRETFTSKVDVRANDRAFLDVHLRYAQPKIVAASKTLTRAEDAPASISVITAEEIRAFGYTRLSDALKAQRGVFVTGDRDYEYVGLRGFYPKGDFDNRVLILVDGHPFNDAWVGQGYADYTFDLDLTDVERIEVVRGPGSALYGSNALFGVVNVVHRAPPEGTSGGAWVRAGSQHGALGASGSVRGERGSLAVRAAFLDGANDPVFVAPDGQLAPGLDGERGFHADLRATWGELSLSAALNDRRKTIPTASFGAMFGADAHAIDGRAFVEARWEHALASGTTLSARLAYDASRYTGHWAYGSYWLDEYGGADWLTAEVRAHVAPIRGNALTVGFEADDQAIYQQVDNSGVPLTGIPADPSHCVPWSGCTRASGSYGQIIGSVYALDDVTLTDWAALNLGARLDAYGGRDFGPQLMPRGALILRPYLGATTKLLAGQAFRAPSYYERFYGDGSSEAASERPGPTRFGTFDLPAAPALTPEKILSFEVEHTHPVSDEVTLLGAAFYNDISHLIGYAPVLSAAGAPSAYFNTAGDTLAVGLEGELRYQPARGILFSAAAWWQRSTCTGREAPCNGTLWPLLRPLLGDGSDPGELVNSPRLGASVRAMIPVVPEVLTLASEAVYGGPRLTGSPVTPLAGEALLWSVSLSGEYARWGLGYVASVQNLLDVHYAHPAGSQEPWPVVPQYGRTLYLELRWSPQVTALLGK